MSKLLLHPDNVDVSSLVKSMATGSGLFSQNQRTQQTENFVDESRLADVVSNNPDNPSMNQSSVGPIMPS